MAHYGIITALIIILLSSRIYSQQVVYKEFLLKEGTIKIKIIDDRNDNIWSSYYAQKIYDLLKAYEAYLDISFHKSAEIYYLHLSSEEKYLIQLYGKDKVYLNGKWIRGYNNTSGIFGPNRGIFVEYDLTHINYPALVFHEIGHYFFYEIPWLNEGIVSFLPLVLYKENFLKLSNEEYHSVWNHWGFNIVEIKKDLPTIDDFRSNSEFIELWYMKTFKIQYILHRELGSKNYQKFLIQLIKDKNSIKNHKDVLSLLNKLKINDWEKILSGWVSQGEYYNYNWKHFSNGNIIKDFLNEN
jgi:hypothetical protein